MFSNIFLLNKMKSFYRIVLFSILYIGLAGCSNIPSISTPKESLEAYIAEGQSIVIVPRYHQQNKKIFWSKVGDNGTNEYFANGFLAGDDYLAIPMEAGTYYLQSVNIKRTKDFKPTNSKKYNSTLNNALLVKTPKEGSKKTVEEYTYGQKIDRTIDNDGHFEIFYPFVDMNNIDENKMIVTITIKPNEIVLIPSISADIEISEDTCAPMEQKTDNFLTRWINSEFHDPSLALIDTVLSQKTNGTNAWTWLCKTDLLTIDIKKSTMDDFLNNAKNGIFSNETLNAIVVRDFSLGKTLINATKIDKIDDGVDRYAIF